MRSITINLPRSWNELDLKQLKFVAKQILKGITQEELPIKCALHFARLRPCTRPDVNGKYWFWYKFRRVLIDAIVLKEMSDSLSFLNSDSFLSKNPVKKIGLLYGPDDCLKNITFDEYETCETFFNKFSKTGDMVYLNKLCAAMYRKKSTVKVDSIDFVGDLREKFNTHTIKSRIWMMRFISLRTKYVIFIFYAGSRNRIANLFPEIFPKKKRSLSLTEESTNASLINTLNQGDITKNDTIRKTPLFEVLLFIKNAIHKHKPT